MDLVFKLHSKRKELWRSLLVDSLCGSVEVVKRNVEAMERSPNIGSWDPGEDEPRVMKGPKLKHPETFEDPGN